MKTIPKIQITNSTATTKQEKKRNITNCPHFLHIVKKEEKGEKLHQTVKSTNQGHEVKKKRSFISRKRSCHNTPPNKGSHLPKGLPPFLKQRNYFSLDLLLSTKELNIALKYLRDISKLWVYADAYSKDVL